MGTNVNILRQTLEEAIRAEHVDMEVVAEVAKALIDAGEEGDLPGLNRFYLGWALVHQGLLVECIPWLKEAGTRLPQGRVERAKAWANVAHAASELGLGATLRESAQRVLEEYGGVTGPDYARCLGVAHHALGQYHEWAREYTTAAYHHEVAAKVYPDPWRQVIALCDQAFNLALAGDLLSAQQVLAAADDHRNHNQTGHFAYLATQAVVLHLSGSFAEALSIGEQALNAHVAANPPKEAGLLTWLCRSSASLNNFSRAREYLRKARAIMTGDDSLVWDEITQLERNLEGVG